MGVSSLDGAGSLNYQSKLSNADFSRVQEEVKKNNAGLVVDVDGNKRAMKQTLNSKEDFLTLLVAQMKNQDPSSPVEDKQFIAQMAQFSTLEQMNNMADGFKQLAAMVKTNNASNLVGLNVGIDDGSKVVTGQVEEVFMGDNPTVQVKGVNYPYQSILSVGMK